MPPLRRCRSRRSAAGGGRRRAAWAVGLTLAAAVNVAAAAAVLSGAHVWEAGARNLDPPFFFTRTDGPWLLLWVATSVGLIAAALAAERPARQWARAGLLVCLTAFLAAGWARAGAFKRYMVGFQFRPVATNPG